MSKRGDIPLGASEPLPAVPGLFVDGLPLITTCMPRWVKTPRVFKFYTSRDPELVKVFFTEIGINVFLLKPPIPVFSPPLNKLKG
ncbi:hypothetical protein PI125_g18294 [Phytophthora idaei]|nr:hypothetical protein PI125_g18294 [Phytophthora idaei]